MTIGYTIETSNRDSIIEDCDFNCYNITEISSYNQRFHEANPSYCLYLTEKIKKNRLLILDGPMDSPWPMYCHDTHHTSRSPYSTADNPGDEKWRKGLSGWVSSPVIDDEGVIYVGAYNFYAISPNGTLKWEYDTPYKIECAPAIDENGILYVGTVWAMPNYLYAFYPDGTLKWKYRTGDHIYSSPVIGDDGTIYFGDGNQYINALYPNGTLKWRYKTGHVVYSSPAIGDDGTIYCGSHDKHLYALYPNNGTVKWRYKTGDWIRTSPCIADDGTIYVVSLDSYLHAVYPNGTLKWKTNVGAGTSPTIGWDGTIYAGYKKLYAINPTNGSVKWTFKPGPERTIRGGTPANSIDGTIYFGTSDGGEIIAVNSNGTEKWRMKIGTCESAPAIGEDGTVYTGSSRLYAFGKLDPDAPDAPNIDGPHGGKAGVEYEYTFKSTSPIDNDVFYYIEWEDGKKEKWIGPHDSGKKITIPHIWDEKGNYTIKARAKDTPNLWGPWSEFEVTIPKNQQTNNALFMRFFKRHSRIFPILINLLKRSNWQ